MALSVFVDKQHPPGGDELFEALGRSANLWRLLKDRMAAQHAPVSEEWVHSGKNYGWSLRLKQKKRAVVYLTPCQRFFLASFALGEKAAAAARASGLPAAVLAIIENAPRYAEGRGVRIEVRSKEDVEIVEQIAAIKMAH